MNEYLSHSGKGHDDNPPGRGSGRYPYGSGKRPFQSNESKNISSTIYDEINTIKKTLSEKDKYFTGETSISKYTKFAKVKNGAYIILDDYGGKFKDEHPYSGLIISIAASPNTRGNGNTDSLIRDIKNKYSNTDKKLIAEIDRDNIFSKKLFERNGFEQIGSFDDIDVYCWDKKEGKWGVDFKMNDYLIHYGTPRRSGRYPYGSGERPYQSTGGISGYFQRKKQKKEQEKVLEKERHDANKGTVLQRGSASQVLKYKGELTNDELSRVVRRLEMEGKLKDYASKETTTSMQKIDEMMKNMKTITNWANIGTDTYNTFASIYNATPSGKNKPMTLVQKQGGGDSKSKKDKKK